MGKHDAPARPFDLSRDFVSGLRPSPPDARDYPAVAALADAGVPMAPAGTPLPVRHQLPIVEPVVQERGDCAVWSGFRIVAEAYRLHRGEPFDPSEELGYAEVRRQMNETCQDRGSWPRLVMDIAHRQGIALEADIPYRSQSICWVPGPEHYALAAFRAAAGYGRAMAGDGILLIDEVKRILWGDGGRGHRVQLCLTLFETYNLIGANGLMPDPAGSVIGHHAQDIDGWDDELGGGGFWVQNQWWHTWGAAGRSFIPYRTFLLPPDRGGAWREDLWTAWAPPLERPDPDPVPKEWHVRAIEVLSAVKGRFEAEATGRTRTNAWQRAIGVASGIDAIRKEAER